MTDVIEEARRNIVRENIRTPDGVRGFGGELVRFSAVVEEKKAALKNFLFHNFYRHPKVMAAMEEAQKMLSDVFLAFSEGGEKMPEQYQTLAAAFGRKKAAADYVAGMTDRFLRDAWKRLSR